MAHIYAWDKAAMGKPEVVRQVALEIMRDEQLDRLVCEIDWTNRLALNLARKVGFKTIGPVRQRKDERGSYNDVILMDALPGDLNG